MAEKLHHHHHIFSVSYNVKQLSSKVEKSKGKYYILTKTLIFFKFIELI